MTGSHRRIAVVTGANRGLGYEAAKQLAEQGLKVVLTSRDQAKGRKAADTLMQEGLDVDSRPLDVSDADSVRQLVTEVQRDFGRVDVLVNNAGVLLDARVSYFWDDRDLEPGEASVLTVRESTVQDTMQVNFYGPLLLTQLVIPLMLRNHYGRIVNVSSGMAQLHTMGGKWPAYRISKVALNALTGVFADELRTDNILVNSADPGWAKTDMGGPLAPVVPAQAVDTIVWLSTLADDGPTGKFFRERREIEW
jgi:NAD(P)-dependent dehydrogenase (short-subunit alcohol dehydrogenase family)